MKIIKFISIVFCWTFLVALSLFQCLFLNWVEFSSKRRRIWQSKLFAHRVYPIWNSMRPVMGLYGNGYGTETRYGTLWDALWDSMGLVIGLYETRYGTLWDWLWDSMRPVMGLYETRYGTLWDPLSDSFHMVTIRYGTLCGPVIRLFPHGDYLLWDSMELVIGIFHIVTIRYGTPCGPVIGLFPHGNYPLRDSMRTRYTIISTWWLSVMGLHADPLLDSFHMVTIRYGTPWDPLLDSFHMVYIRYGTPWDPLSDSFHMVYIRYGTLRNKL